MVWRVLVADDDPETRATIAEILRSPALEIDTCPDAESALLALRRDKPYHVLISDFMLPGNSGIELLTMVRSDPRTSALPVLMITGQGNLATKLRAESSGANRFLYKPFTARQMRSIVEELLKGQPRTPASEPAP